MSSPFILFKDVAATFSLPSTCIEEVQLPSQLHGKTTSEGLEIHVCGLREGDSHSFNIRLISTQVSILSDSFSVHFRAQAAKQDAWVEETVTVDPFELEDSNDDHDTYRANIARILFVAETKKDRSSLAVEQLDRLESILSSLPRSGENATISGLIEDVHELRGALATRDSEFEYCFSAAFDMHSKGRGVRKTKGKGMRSMNLLCRQILVP